MLLWKNQWEGISTPCVVSKYNWDKGSTMMAAVVGEKARLRMKR